MKGGLTSETILLKLKILDGLWVRVDKCRGVAMDTKGAEAASDLSHQLPLVGVKNNFLGVL